MHFCAFPLTPSAPCRLFVSLQLIIHIGPLFNFREGWSHAVRKMLRVRFCVKPRLCVPPSSHMSVQELQRDIEQHTEGVASVLSLCDVLLQDEDAAGGDEAEGDSLQETSRSLDQRWRTICAMALDRKLR